MKKQHFLALLLCIFTASAFAQTPAAFNFQAVARDAQNQPHANKTLGVRASILNASNTAVYVETHNPVVTSSLGVFTLAIGSLNPTLDQVNWAAGPYSLKIEINPDGLGFKDLQTTPLLYVPYALYAKQAETVKNPPPTTVQSTAPITGDGTSGNKLRLENGTASDQVLKWNGTAWTPQPDATGTGGITQITAGTGLTGGTITTSGTIGLSNTGVTAATYGSAAQIPVFTVDAQGRITAANNVAVSGDGWGTAVVQHDATLQGNGAGIPLGLAQNGAASGQVLKWNGTTWLPANDIGDNWGTQVVQTAPALTGQGTTGSKLDIAPDGVTTAHIKDGTITINDIAAGVIPPPLNLVAGAGISITGSAPNQTITNTGDTNATDDLTTASTAMGDVTGPFSDLQIAAGAVAQTELATDAVDSTRIKDNSVAAADLHSMGANDGQVLQYDGTNDKWRPATFSASGIIGTGTPGTLPKFGMSTTLVNSVVTESSGGGVGIGVANPTKAKLEISGAVGNTSAIFGKTTGLSIIGGHSNQNLLGFNSYWEASDVKTISDGNVWYSGSDIITGDYYFNYHGKHSAGQNAPYLRTAMLFDTAGGVGIGGIHPTKAKLEVATSDQTSAIFGSGQAGISIQQNCPTIGWNQYNENGTGKYMSDGTAMVQYYCNGKMYFQPQSNGVKDQTTVPLPNPVLTLEPSSVGINNAAPTQALDVNGKIKSTFVTGTQNASIYLNTNTVVNAIEMDISNSNPCGILSNSNNFGIMAPMVGIGTLFPAYKLDVNGTTSLGGSTFIGGNVGIKEPISTSFALSVNGTACKTGGGSWSNCSDRRLKKDIQPFSEGLEAVLKINPVSYHYNGLLDLPTESLEIGVIAQELQEIAPHMVTEFEGRDGNQYLSVNSSSLDFMFVNAFKEQQATITTQQQKIESLEQQVSALQAQFGAWKAEMEQMKAERKEEKKTKK